MDTLYIFYYNNYLNRRVIFSNNLVDYGEPYYTQENVNFKPNNEIITKQVVGRDDYDGKGDYLLVCDDEDNILSRWFIIDEERLRNGQHQLTLRNDLMVENYDDIVNSPMIIEKAMVNSVDNPFLYNNEGFSFNQIKKQEILLKDKTNTPWYVLYFKDSTEETDSFTIPTNYDVRITGSLASSIYASGTQKYCSDININTRFVATRSGGYYGQGWKMINSSNGISYISMETPNFFVPQINNTTNECKTQLTTAFTNQYNTLSASLLTDNGDSNTITLADYQTLISVGNSGYRVYSVADDKIYTITVLNTKTTKDGTKTSGTCFTSSKALYNGTTLNVDFSGHYSDNFLTYDYVVNTLTITAIEDTTDTFTWKLFESGKATTDDSDYNIVAIPYNDCLYRITDLGQGVYYNRTSSSVASKLLVKSIINKYGTKLSDVQLLPYCPLQSKIIDRINLADETLYTEVHNASQRTFALYVPKASFSFNITKQLTSSLNALERKIQNETQLCKIVSPNYNGSFEFSVAKNGGVDYFNIDVTLIPYQPYIHINPNFKGLYGTDWNDSKGLICGGDFSLPLRRDQWEEYKINNKNYQQIFDRQIQNLDFNQSQERIQAGWNIGSGTLQGTATGAMSGFMMGGGYGAIAGAMVGGAMSLGGGLIDYSMLKDRQAESRQFAIDNWKYQLGNIKALPDTITKVTPLTYNNKLFPFIEVYECTDEEKDMFRQYITYQSMTINTIGTISEYKQSNETFIKGKLIRINDAKIDYDKAEEIYNELNKGVYI